MNGAKAGGEARARKVVYCTDMPRVDAVLPRTKCAAMPAGSVRVVDFF